MNLTRSSRTCFAALSALALSVATLVAAPSAGAAGFDPAPARAALHRLLPGRDRQIELVPAKTGADFTVSGRTGAIRVAGSSPANLLAGVGWYLEHVARVDIGLTGDSLNRLPARLPAPARPVTEHATVPHRYALNDTDDGYSGPYRDFADYQHEIDVLTLHGINEVFVQVGAENVYYNMLRRFGYTADELRKWIPGSAHQPWWLLQNMSGFGGPESPRLLAARATLGAQITTRLRSLGMTPVLPGYFGTVPPDFAKRNPGATVVPQGDWSGFARPDWLAPTSPVFPKVAAAYYAEQQAEFGPSTMYKMDLLHEGGKPGPVDVGAAAHAVQQALLAAHPDAIWAILGWQSNPTPALLAGVDKQKMLIVDGLADRYNDLDREKTWGDTPYAFGTIPNFGGHTSIGANTGVWATRFRQWLSKPDSKLSGIAYFPEGTTGDPAAFEMFTDLAWQPVDQTTWFTDYATRRYGAADAHTTAAWNLLRTGPYNMASGKWSEPQDSLFSARPALDARTAAAFSPQEMRYDPDTVESALGELLAAGPAVRGSTAYRGDVVDIARQSLANRARALLPKIKAAYDAADLSTFRTLVSQWNRDEQLLDRITGTDPRLMLGPWIAAARSKGANPEESAQLSYDAKSILATWGDRQVSETGELHNYANREWSGLISGVYAPEWAAYFAGLDTALVKHTTPAPIDWFAFENTWAHSTKAYPTTPSGNPFAIAGLIAHLPH